MDLAGGGCLDLDDPTADFEFVPAMTPKGKGSRAAPAFAPSPVREEPEEERGGGGYGGGGACGYGGAHGYG